MQKRTGFTLIELIFAITLIALLAGFVGKGVVGTLGTFRYQNQVTCLSTHLQKLQIQAMTYQIDIRVYIHPDSYRTELDAKIKGIEQRTKKLSNISKITLDHKEESEIIVTIFSNGRIEPLGILGLHGKKESRFFDFRKPLQFKVTHEIDKLSI